MDNATIIDTIRELMTEYNRRRAELIDCYGSAAGFDTWFTKQVIG